MRDGRLLLETAAGNVTADLKAGQSYTRNEGVEHNVVNANDFEYVFVEIELKEPPAAGKHEVLGMPLYAGDCGEGLAEFSGDLFHDPARPGQTTGVIT